MSSPFNINVIIDERCPDVCRCWYDDYGKYKVTCEHGWDEQTVENIVKITEAL